MCEVFAQRLVFSLPAIKLDLAKEALHVVVVIGRRKIEEAGFRELQSSVSQLALLSVVHLTHLFRRWSLMWPFHRVPTFLLALRRSAPLAEVMRCLERPQPRSMSLHLFCDGHRGRRQDITRCAGEMAADRGKLMLYVQYPPFTLIGRREVNKRYGSSRNHVRRLCVRQSPSEADIITRCLWTQHVSTKRSLTSCPGHPQQLSFFT